MDVPGTDGRVGSGDAALIAENRALREALAERDARLAAFADLLAERDNRLADLTDPVRDPQAGIRLPGNCRDARTRSRPSWPNRCVGTGKRRRPSPTYRKMTAGNGARAVTRRGPSRPVSGDSGAGTRACTTAGQDPPRRRARGTRHTGWQAHTVRDIVFHTGEITWLREVRRFPDGTQYVAPLQPGAARGRGVRARRARPDNHACHQCRST